MDIAASLDRLDRLVGGRHAGHRNPPSEDPSVRRTFRAVAAVLVVCLLLGVGTVVAAAVITLLGGTVGFAVWMRSVVVLGITTTLFYFLARAVQGRYWALRRLQLFSRIFPVVAIALAASGLYPGWIVLEQVVFAVLLLAVSALLGRASIRAAFPAPGPGGVPVSDAGDGASTAPGGSSRDAPTGAAPAS